MKVYGGVAIAVLMVLLGATVLLQPREDPAEAGMEDKIVKQIVARGLDPKHFRRSWELLKVADSGKVLTNAEIDELIELGITAGEDIDNSRSHSIQALGFYAGHGRQLEASRALEAIMSRTKAPENEGFKSDMLMSLYDAHSPQLLSYARQCASTNNPVSTDTAQVLLKRYQDASST